MKKIKHTPGPYGYGEDRDGWFLESESAKAKLGHGDQIAYCLSEGDARRISACLNACNGFPDEALDGGWTAKGISRYAKSLERQIEALKASKAELLAELQRMVQLLEVEAAHLANFGEVEAARAAIARATAAQA